MWLDTVTGKRLTTPPSSEGGVSVTPIEENENDESTIEPIDAPMTNDRKRSKPNRKGITYAMENSSIEETQ